MSISNIFLHSGEEVLLDDDDLDNLKWEEFDEYNYKN